MESTALDSPRDHIRWIKHTQKGMRVEEIATQEGTTQEDVLASIKRYESVRMLLTREEMEADQIAILRANNELRRNAIAAALSARKMLTVTDDQGYETVVEGGPDHDVQLRAVETEISLITALMPKGGTKVAVAVQNNAGGMRSASTFAVDDSMEARVRNAMERRKALMAAPPGAIVPDVFVDGRAQEADFEDGEDDDDAEDGE